MKILSSRVFDWTTGRLITSSAAVYGTTISNPYRANPNLIDQPVHKRARLPILTTTKQFDKLNRLSGISSVSSVPSVVNSAAYGFNSVNQRTRLTEADGKFWDFDYDALGQVTSGVKKLTDSNPVLGHSFGYNFDTIGNLKTTAVNGQSATYTPDTAGLNQYASRTVPAALDIIGTADAGAKVAVNLAPAQRQGDLFYKQLPVANAAIAKWQPIDVLAGKTGAGVGGADADTRQSGHLFLAKTPENFAYDFDGNLTSDSQWSYVWDAENRLVSMETQASAATAGVPKQKLEFAYDSAGRRIQKRVSNWSGTAYTLASDIRFLYDGWNLLAEFNALSSNAVIRSYVWGIDLSGSAQGAGGVGGLLAINQSSSIAHLPCYDGNGNVTGLIDSTTGVRSATFTYGPFGESIAAYGPAAAANPFRFSTKYTDAETGQLYYGYRYYNPSTKRWLSRDPIGERGGINMYGMVGNNPLNHVDHLGLVYAEEVTSNSLSDILSIYGVQAYTGLSYGVGIARPLVRSSTDDEIATAGCCAKVVKAKRIDVDVLTVLPNDAIGNFSDAAGYEAIVSNENRRRIVYRKAYDAYIAPIESSGRLATKCRLCGEKSKEKLQQYLETIRKKGIEAYNRWIDDQQGRGIGGENLSPLFNAEGLFTGFERIHVVGEPPPIEETECPKL